MPRSFRTTLTISRKPEGRVRASRRGDRLQHEHRLPRLEEAAVRNLEDLGVSGTRPQCGDKSADSGWMDLTLQTVTGRRVVFVNRVPVLQGQGSAMPFGESPATSEEAARAGVAGPDGPRSDSFPRNFGTVSRPRDVPR